MEKHSLKNYDVQRYNTKHNNQMILPFIRKEIIYSYELVKLQMQLKIHCKVNNIFNKSELNKSKWPNERDLQKFVIIYLCLSELSWRLQRSAEHDYLYCSCHRVTTIFRPLSL